jgi:MraZ protein
MGENGRKEREVARSGKLCQERAILGTKFRELESGGGFVVLVGTYEHNLDAKGRLVLPAKFRDAFESKKGFLSPLPQGGIALRTDAEFKRMSDVISVTMYESPEAENAARALAANSYPVDFEGSQGRIAIPESMRREFGLEGQVVVSGFFDHVEIWAPEVFRRVLGRPSAVQGGN